MTSIEYDVKEVLDRIDRDNKDAFNRLESMIRDGQNRLETRVSGLETDVEVLKRSDYGRRTLTTSVHTWLPILVSLGAVAVAALR